MSEEMECMHEKNIFPIKLQFHLHFFKKKFKHLLPSDLKEWVAKLEGSIFQVLQQASHFAKSNKVFKQYGREMNLVQRCLYLT